MTTYSISFFYQSTLLHTEIIPFNDVEPLMERGNEMILETLRGGASLAVQIQTYQSLLHKMVHKKRLFFKQSKFQRRLGAFAILNLLKLRALTNDYDNGYIILKNKSKRKVSPLFVAHS